jgi:O-antigen ligase
LTDGDAGTWWTRPSARTGAADREVPYAIGVAGLLLGHMLLAYVMKQSPIVGAVHAIGSLALGVFWLSSDRTANRVVYICAYIAGAEVLWRMTNAPIFWEYGKYAVTALAALAILKQHALPRASKASLLYLALLLPSLALLPELDRSAISFYLSGPLSLAVATVFFSAQNLTSSQRDRVLLSLMMPIIGVALLATLSTITSGPISFGTESMFVTSGGFGPNQVSSILGLGALCGLLYAVAHRGDSAVRALVFVCALWLLAQAALTFSRGGLYTGIGALAVAAVYLMSDPRVRAVLLVVLATASVLAAIVILPALDGFTGGALVSRFQDTDPTGRDKIVEADLLVFRDNPLFGVGPGQSGALHATTFRESATHTEYSRMLSEHGVLGLGSLLVLAVICLQRLRSSAPPLAKAFSLAFTVWALLFMTHAAMRLVAPSLAFGLASATLLLDSDDPSASESAELDSNVVLQELPSAN